MAAVTSTSMALLTIYDMGKSGHWIAGTSPDRIRKQPTRPIEHPCEWGSLIRPEGLNNDKLPPLPQR